MALPMKMKAPKNGNHKFSLDMQIKIDTEIDTLIEIEKEHYASTIVPFEHHAEQMRLKGQQFFAETFTQYKKAQEVMKAQCDIQDQKGMRFPEDASYKVWEEAVQTILKKKEKLAFDESFFDPTQLIQDQLGLPWPFMDRVYGIANELFAEKKYEDAVLLYCLLRTLNPGIFAYWYGEAAALQMQGHFEEAIEAYGFSLILDTQNPDVFFQIASCCFHLGEKESSVKALECCIEYAKERPECAALSKTATQLKATLS